MAYVYRHIRLDKNEPFYIGICKHDDSYFKRAGSNTRNNIWKKIAAKTDYEVEILFSNVDIDFAKKKEIEFINLYGRICCGTGTLANIGGGGEPMFNPPEYLKEKLRQRSKGKGNPFYGKKHTEETRKKISKANLGKKKKPLSEETKRKIGLAHKGKPTWIKGIKQPEAGKKRSGVNHRTYRGPVLCYDLNMNLVKEFSCTKEAVEYFEGTRTDRVTRVLIGERNSWRNHIFRYKDEKLFFVAEERAKKRKEQAVINNKKARPNAYESGVLHFSYRGPILCYDRKGNFVKEFLTTKEAAEHFGYPNSMGSIARVLKGNDVKFWHGYSFIYKNQF